MNKRCSGDGGRAHVQGKKDSRGHDCSDDMETAAEKERMVSVSGRVIEIAGGNVWAETNSLSACHHCADRHGCGVSALSKVFGQRVNRIRVSNSMNAHLGDEVILGISETALLKETLMLYMAPLLGMLIAVAVAEALFNNEVLSVLAALCGLAIGFALVRWYALRNAKLDAIKPVMLSCKRVDRNIP